MGPLCNKRWLQNSVSRTTNSVTRPSLLPAASKSASGRRSRQSSLKGGSGGDNSGMSRTLLQNFPSSQEERETQADNRPLCAQSFCVHTDIQNGDAEKSERCRSTERLGIFIGSDGRLFAYPDTLSVSQIHQIHVERLSVPVQGTPIRPLDKSFRVYTPYGGHRDFPKEKGDNSTSLSQRLARSEPKSSKTVGTQTIHFVADQLTRSDHQLRKIRPSSSPSVHFHRDGVSDPYQYRQSTSEQANEDIGDSQNVFTENLCISQRLPVSLGTTECCSRSCNAGTVTSPAITSISAQSVETSESSIFSSDLYDFGNSVSSQMVASGRSLSSGDSLEDRSSLSHHLYRCQPVRLGSPCGTGGTSVSWTMDRRPIPAPHQCVRDESNFPLSITSSSQGKEHHCTGIHGQHYSGGLYKASGRDSFHRTLRRSVECPEFVLQSQHTAVSEAHTGQVQHSSRPDVQSGQTDLHRVVLESGNSKQSFPDHGLSVKRPVRHTSEPQATILCVTHTGSKALSIDALSMDWNRIHAYAFPPFHLIPAVINKIRLSQCKIVLIAPLWPDRPWFPELLSLLVSPPVSLPVIPNLLAQLKGRILHQNPGHLQLHAWELSNNHCKIDNFQGMLRSTSPKPEGNRLLKSMMQNGKSSVVGQINGRLILSRPLPR